MAGRRGNFLSALLGASIVAVVVAVLAVTGTFDDDPDGTATVMTAATRTVPDVPAPAATRTVTAVSELYRKVRNGAVYVRVSAHAGPGEQQGSGSGFVLDESGHILTNDHVVENADVVQVRIGESEKLIPAKVTGTDPSSDLAVIKVDPKDVDGGLNPLTLGSSGSVQVGQPAIAIGSPFGLQGSLTTGVISALGRPIQAPNGFQISGALQTDAAINPGNSGGPLLDADGRVIGINAQIETGPSGARSNSGVGFAIPIDIAKRAIPALQRGERIRRAFLGVSTADAANGTGADIATVVRGGPAADAGLRTGDRIVKVGGQAVADSADVATRIAGRKPGDVVEVVVRRDGRQRTLQVRLGTQPRSVGARDG